VPFKEHHVQGVSTVFRPVGARVASQQSPILPLAGLVYFRRQKSQYPYFQKVSFRLKQNTCLLLCLLRAKAMYP